MVAILQNTFSNFFFLYVENCFILPSKFDWNKGPNGAINSKPTLAQIWLGTEPLSEPMMT